MRRLFPLLFIGLLGCTNQKSESKSEIIKNNITLNHINHIKDNLIPIHYLKGHSNKRSITQMMEEDNILGISIAFIENDKIAWQKTFGYSNLKDSVPVTPFTVFNGASLSKPIAAMAALKLSDKGYISLNEDVNNYLKDWKVPNNKFTEKQKVTLKRLIGHTAGIENHISSSYSLNEEAPSITQMLAGEKPSVDPPVSVVYVPGEKLKYSNPGYYIIQKLIEDVSDTKFESVIEELIFKPCEMDYSSFEQPLPASLLEKTATGYSNDLTPYPYKIFPFKAAGGIWTTPTDLGKFLIALLKDYHTGKNIILSKAMADSVFKINSERLGFGKIYNQENQDLLFEHWGSNSGFTSYMVASLNKKQGVVIMTNSDNGTILMSYIARAVAQEYGWEFLQPTKFEPYELSIEKMKSFVGKFTGGNETMEFKIHNRNFIVKDAVNNNSILIPVAEDKFILPEHNTLYEFLTDKNKKVNYVRITNSDSYNNDYRKQE